PRMDVHESSESNATFELPGIKKEDVQTDIHNCGMSISAESKISESHEKDTFLQQDLSL
ncbi:hypothetical protein B0H11DRAFT_1661304, partial [Mycena galericulata]